MFKHIDNKTERSVEANIQSLATKDDLQVLKGDIQKEFVNVRREISDVRKEIGHSKADTIKWMFIFWIGQVGAMLGIILLFFKK